MNLKTLRGLVVVITGAGSGIGRETALALGKTGARLVLVGRKAAPLEETAALLLTDCRIVTADATNPTDCARVRDETIRAFGRIDALVNNAGVSMRGEFGDTDPSVFRAMVEGNLLGPMLMTRAFIADLKASHGRVCFVSSLAGLYGLPEVSGYSASKMGLTGLAQSLRTEHAGSGVSFTVVHIGLVDNDPGKRVYGADGSMVPLNRPSQATRKQAASFIVRALAARKKTAYHTPAGKAIAIAVRFMPGLVGSLSAFSRTRLRRLYD